MHFCKHEGCDAYFASFTSLKRHEQIHSGERPYACEHGCGKQFARSSHIRCNFLTALQEIRHESTSSGTHEGETLRVHLQRVRQEVYSEFQPKGSPKKYPLGQSGHSQKI